MNPLSGFEYDWFCTDSEGCIGAFATAGQGPIPLSVQNDLERYGHLQEYVGSLPSTGSYLIALKDIMTRSGFVKIGESPIPDDAHARKAYKDWFKYASQGLYAFDWRDVHRHHSKSGKYELVAKPTTPLNITSVAMEFREQLEFTSLKRVAFNKVEAIDVTQLLDCGKIAK